MHGMRVPYVAVDGVQVGPDDPHVRACAEPWLPIPYASVQLISVTPTSAVPGLRGSGSGTSVQVGPFQ